MTNYYAPPAFSIGILGDAYLRDSGGEKQDRSVESQRAEVLAYMRKHGISLRRIYQDTAKSGKTIAGREHFERMIADYENGDTPGILILWDYARFARNAREAVVAIANIEDHGVIVHSLTDNIPDGEYKDLVRYIKHMGNQAEREKNSRAVKRELHQLVKEKKAMFGVPPRGFKREALEPIRNERTGEMRTLHKWVPDPEAAASVLRAFEMRAQGRTLAEINAVTRLYGSVSCYGTFWDNKLYKGVLEFGGETIADYCDPIVPPALWDAVNAKRQKRKPGGGIHDPRRVRSQYILSGLIFCQNCGAALTGHTINQWEYYICSKRKLTRGVECSARHIPKEIVENAVIEAVKENALSLETIVNLQGRVTKEIERLKGDSDRARLTLRRDLLAQNKIISNLTKAIGAHGHSPALLDSLQQAEAEAANFTAKLKALEEQTARPTKTAAQLKEIAAAIAAQLEGTPQQKQTILRTFVTRIIALRDTNALRVVIKYIPLRVLNPDELGHGNVPPWGHNLFSKTSAKTSNQATAQRVAG